MELNSRRFVSMARPEIGCYRYTLRLLRGKGEAGRSQALLTAISETKMPTTTSTSGSTGANPLDEDSLAVVLETKKDRVHRSDTDRHTPVPQQR